MSAKSSVNNNTVQMPSVTNILLVNAFIIIPRIYTPGQQETPFSARSQAITFLFTSESVSFKKMRLKTHADYSLAVEPNPAHDSQHDCYVGPSKSADEVARKIILNDSNLRYKFGDIISMTISFDDFIALPDVDKGVR